MMTWAIASANAPSVAGRSGTTLGFGRLCQIDRAPRLRVERHFDGTGDDAEGEPI